jgi:hypothetical protein
MFMNFASAIQRFSQGNVEDGTVAGEGLTGVETFAYFFATPVVSFVLISVLVYALTGDRKKAKSTDSVITTIE